MSSILIFRNEQQEGPYDLDQIREGLASGYFSPQDLAWTEGQSDWAPLRSLIEPVSESAPPPARETASEAAALPADRIASAISRFVTEDQDPKVVAKILGRVKELLTAGEEVAFIAVQKRPIVTVAPDAIVLTNRRFMIVRPKLTGMTFTDLPWREVANIHMSEQMLSATVICQSTTGQKVAIEHIPKKQARRIYSYGQEVEERMVEERRQRAMEERRAGAGGVVFQGFPGQAPGQVAAPSAASGDDPLATLGKLKQMLDAGLISPAEYEGKKADVLAKM